MLDIEFHFNDGRRSGGGAPGARRGPGGPRPGGPGGPLGSGRGPLAAGGPRAPRRDQRNGDAPVVAPAAAVFEAAVSFPEAVGVEEPRLGAEPTRKPRAPRTDDRRRPYVS